MKYTITNRDQLIKFARASSVDYPLDVPPVKVNGLTEILGCVHVRDIWSLDLTYAVGTGSMTEEEAFKKAHSKIDELEKRLNGVD